MLNKNMCHKVVAILLVIGGLNWGLIGLGTLIDSDLNVINAILGGSPTAEAILYLLIGLAALKAVVMTAMGKCKGGKCC